MADKTYVCIGASNHTDKEREPNDYYATHPSAINKLLSKVYVRRNVWECSCGQMHLASRLKELGHDVYASDIIVRPNEYKMECHQQDFLETTRKDVPFEGYCDIVTNPPYKYAMEFVLHALNLICEKQLVCMFLKLTFLEGITRYNELFSKYPPKKVLVFSGRMQCAKNAQFQQMRDGGGSAVAYAWYIWEKGYQGKTTIEWI